jgi:hypothetical protein
VRTRNLVALAAVAACAAPAAAATPSRFALDTTLAPGARAALTVGTVPQGEFAFRLRASSDGEKRVLVTQQRAGGRRFPVISLPGAGAEGVCQGAAGSIFCAGITTPAMPGGRSWTFTIVNRSTRPMSVTLSIAWRRVASAG